MATILITFVTINWPICTKNVYPRKSRGTKHRAFPPLQKVGGEISPVHPRITHGCYCVKRWRNDGQRERVGNLRSIACRMVRRLFTSTLSDADDGADRVAGHRRKVAICVDPKPQLHRVAWQRWRRQCTVHVQPTTVYLSPTLPFPPLPTSSSPILSLHVPAVCVSAHQYRGRGQRSCCVRIWRLINALSAATHLMPATDAATAALHHSVLCFDDEFNYSWWVWSFVSPAPETVAETPHRPNFKDRQCCSWLVLAVNNCARV